MGVLVGVEVLVDVGVVVAVGVIVAVGVLVGVWVLVGVCVLVGVVVGVAVNVAQRPETPGVAPPKHTAPRTTVHPSQLPPTGPPQVVPHWQQSFTPGVGTTAKVVAESANSKRTTRVARLVLLRTVRLHQSSIMSFPLRCPYSRLTFDLATHGRLFIMRCLSTYQRQGNDIGQVPFSEMNTTPQSPGDRELNKKRQFSGATLSQVAPAVNQSNTSTPTGLAQQPCAQTCPSCAPALPDLSLRVSRFPIAVIFVKSAQV